MRSKLLTLIAVSASWGGVSAEQIVLPPEIQARLQARLAGENLIESSSDNKEEAKKPEDVRLDLLKKLIIDRTSSGILQARLKKSREDEVEAEKVDLSSKTPEEIEIVKIKEDIAQFELNLNLGEWKKAGEYLAALEEKDAKAAYDRILQQLAASVNVVPRSELAAAGAQPLKHKQFVRASDVLAISNMSPKAPEKSTLSKLSKLLQSSDHPPKEFFEQIGATSRYFGSADTETSLRTALFLMDAGHFEEAKPYLPTREQAQEAKDYTSLNLLARWHAKAHRGDKGDEHLPQAWDISLGLIGEKEAPYNDRAEALYRALGLVPDLEGGAGQEWLNKTFAAADGEGFEILAMIGTLAAQVHQHPSPEYRLEQIKLQRAAAQALLGTPGIDPEPWREILTLYARNWLYEAKHTNKYDTSTSMRPEMSVDSFGNPFYTAHRYTRSMVGRTVNGKKIVAAIQTGDLMREGLDEHWMSMLDESVQVQALIWSSRLYLRVKEHQKALPLIEKLAKVNPEEAEGLCRDLIRVWAENNNPNQQSQYRSSYYYFSGYNQRAETIPLTRSKQERNLRELAGLMQTIQKFDLGETFDKEFADAFIQCHSQAEVWRVEALEAVFGDLKNLDPKTAASLLRRMRGNLANLWPKPKVQAQAKTKRKDKELRAQVLRGYNTAGQLCIDVLNNYPNDWALKIQQAALDYEESNYRASLGSHPEHSATKRQALNDLAEACAIYVAALPLENKDDESDEPFTTWFYAALGSPDLGALKSHHQPVPSEFAKIKEALDSLPEAVRKRHMTKFAKTLNTRLANVGADLKYRFLESVLPITGDNEHIADATKVFQYYQDLVTEIQLDVYLDGADRVNTSQPFGLYANLRHTREIERESGGFQRYLINQNNNQYSYNYGRPTEDYRDKFEKAARAALEEHFEVVSLTFHNSKVQARTDPELGWTVTPYAYFLLKPKGPEVDSIPPLKIDLDFLDTSGYVVLPISSAAIPVDASGEAELRPHRNLQLTLTLDEREAEESKQVALEVRASAHGLVPPLDSILDLEFEGFELETDADNELLVAELDAETDDGAPISTREWRLILTPKSDHLPASFAFPELKKGLNMAEEDSLTLQRYDDVDLIPSEDVVKLGAGKDSKWSFWWFVILLPILGFICWLMLKKKDGLDEIAPSEIQLPNTLTPVTVIAFLKKIHQNAGLGEAKGAELLQEIEQLESRSFSSDANLPTKSDLVEIAKRWGDRSQYSAV